MSVENTATELTVRVAELEAALAVRERESNEASELQTATSEVLRLISANTGDLRTVLDSILSKAAEICGADGGAVLIRRGEVLVFESEIGPYWGTYLGKEVPVAVAGPNVKARDQHAPFFIDDFDAFMRARRDPVGISLSEMQGNGGSSFVTVALMQDDEWLGNLNLYRDRVDPFDPKFGPILQAFADQAAVAVANARLFNDLDAALEQQTATSEILQIISTSPGDLELALTKIGAAAMRLCDGDHITVGFWDEEFRVFWDPLRGIRSSPRTDSHRARFASSFMARAADENRSVLVSGPVSVWEKEFTTAADYARTDGLVAMSNLAVPLRGPNGPFGAVSVRRNSERPFNGHDDALLQRLADQAVIAIENSRLFNALEERNREVSEALEQQTAVADVLRLISAHPGDLQTVLDGIVASAAKLCDAESANVALREDRTLRTAAVYGERMQSGFGAVYPIRSDIPSPLPIELRRPLFRDDFQAVVKDTTAAEAANRLDIRSFASMPLVHDNEWIGDLRLIRHEVRPFDESIGPVLATYADQAAIAVANAQLFNDLESSNREVTAALEQQTATAEIMSTISSAPGDIETTLPVIGRSARRLCEADYVALLFFGTVTMGRSATTYAAAAISVDRRSGQARRWRARRFDSMRSYMSSAPSTNGETSFQEAPRSPTTTV